MYPNMFVVIQRNGVVLGIDHATNLYWDFGETYLPAKLGEPQRIDNYGRRKEKPHIGAKKP